MESDPTKRSFPPVVDQATRLLVLGSLPGERSLAEARYYAHPRNQFWQLMSGVIDRDLTALGYADRLAALLAAQVGLWDVVESASRSGSLDAKIRDHRPNRLAELAASLPNLGAVAFNGGTAARIGRPQLVARPDLALIALPSSSPAFTMTLAEKSARWSALRPWAQKISTR
jgi:TDG/mug DNA glycosylase family protein